MSKTSVSGKIWEAKNIDERLVYKYINDFEISDLLARILVARNVEEDKMQSFIHPKIRDLLPDPFHLLDMEKACKKVAEKILAGDKITVLGDYDVDGATSSALLKRVFTQLGANCSVHIPDRAVEGYGPTLYAIDKFKKEDSKLVITVDCGITSFDAIKYANSVNLEVIILDHHLSAEILPDAYAIVNPNRFDETTRYKNLAAVGVAFLFSVGLIKILRNHGYFQNIEEPNLLDLLDLVALGTICDMMSLVGLNRAFVIQGLKIMSKRKNLGLKILAEYGKIDSKLTAYHLSFVIGPRINAGGRVGKSYLGSHLLSTNDENTAFDCAAQLEIFNEERKVIEQKVLDEAIQIVERQQKKNYILIFSDTWHPGVIGIVAGKIKDLYQKPVVVIAIEEDIGKASCRSVKGIDLGSKIVEAKNRNILLSGGGHAMAAGFTLRKDCIDSMIEFLDFSMSKENNILLQNKNCFFDISLSPNGVSLEIAEEIQKLEPYGNGNSEPIIKVDGMYVLKATITNRHINCLLASDSSTLKSKAIRAIAFNSVGTPVGDALLSAKPLNLSILGNLKINHWQGMTTTQISICDIIVN